MLTWALAWNIAVSGLLRVARLYMEELLCYSKQEHTVSNSTTLQRTNTKNSKQIFPEKELRGHSPNFHIHVSVSDLYIPMIDLAILLQEYVCGPILGIYKLLTDI